MITTSRFINTDEYEIELTIKMTVRHWRELSGQLSEKWPSWDLSRHINEATRKLESHVRVSDPDVPETR